MSKYGIVEFVGDLNRRSATYIIDRYMNLKNKYAGSYAKPDEWRDFYDYYGITKADYSRVVRSAYLRICKEYGLKPIR